MISFFSRVKRYIHRILYFHRSEPFLALEAKVFALKAESEKNISIVELREAVDSEINQLKININSLRDDVSQALNVNAAAVNNSLCIFPRASQRNIIARELLRRFQPYDVVGHQFCRVGRMHDGGYVMLDDFEGIAAAYSLGISDDTSWDQSIADRNIPVYMYDHTIEDIPYPNFLFQWKKTGLGPYIAQEQKLKTLHSLVFENGHGTWRNLILKMDIEHAEWDALLTQSLALLEQFKQIVIELHFSDLAVPGRYAKKIAVLDMLLEHHAPVHVHANNFGGYMAIEGVEIPETWEITYARRTDYQMKPNTRYFPTMLDFPCNKNAPDYALPFFSIGV